METATKPQNLKGCIYLRLSKDDESAGESISISNQRKFLLRYAKEHHLPIKKEFSDDGFSGTSFNRPAFIQMIAAIEQKEINLVLTKDLSRLGRDYIKTGQYTELFFPSHGVRLIAVGDGYDSAFSSTDMIPFRNIVNEMYARDISRKIKASLQVRMDEGAFIGNFAPYGYAKGTDNRHMLVPDPEAAPIIKSIFSDAASGCRPSEIANDLNQKNILSPALYRCKKHPGLEPENYTKRGLWTANTIIKILHNPVYLGHMCQGKTQKVSFKSSINISVPLPDRITVLHTHQALVSDDIFRRCQEVLLLRTCKKKSVD